MAGRKTKVDEESPVALKRRARKINRILGDTYPYAVAELDFRNPFELLVATVLSAQTTDVRVNLTNVLRGTLAREGRTLEKAGEQMLLRRAAGDVQNSHSARLLARGSAKVAQKLGEEAVECVIEAALGHRPEIVLESADVLYHLLVVWVDAGVRPEEVWAELRRREGISGIAEKAARPA